MRYTRNLNVREDRHMRAPTVDQSHPHDFQGRVHDRLPVVPRYIHYHIEHHWYPSVPFYNLPALHAHLLAQPEFRQHAVVTTSVLASLRQCLAR